MYDTRDINFTADNMVRMISAVIDNRLENLSYDTTIKGVIISKHAFGDRKTPAKIRYKVRDNGGVVYLCKDDVNIYEENDKVYIHLPAGDPDNNVKLIVGKVANDNSRGQTKIDIEEQDPIPLDYLTPTYIIKSSANEDIVISDITKITTIPISFGNLIKDFITYCHNGVKGLELKASFMNNFTFPVGKKSTTFSYGVQLIFTCKENSVFKDKIIQFDSRDMLGSPYNFIVPVEQTFQVNFDDYAINPLTIENIQGQLYINGRIFEEGSLTLHTLSLRGIEQILEDEPTRVFVEVSDTQIKIPKVWTIGAKADIKANGYSWGTQYFSQTAEFKEIVNSLAEMPIYMINPIGRVTNVKCSAESSLGSKFTTIIPIVKSDNWYELFIAGEGPSLTAIVRKFDYTGPGDNLADIKNPEGNDILTNWQFDWFYKGKKISRDKSSGSFDSSRPWICYLNSTFIFEDDTQEEYNSKEDLYCVAYVIDSQSGFSSAAIEAKYIQDATTVWKVEYAAGESTAPAEGWSEDPNVTVAAGQYKWTRTIYSNGTIAYTSAYQGTNGVSPIIVQIESSTGDLYINNNINAVLTAKVIQGTTDITDQLDPDGFLWKKFDINGDQDTGFSQRGYFIEITSSDIIKKATFICDVEIKYKEKKEN